MKDFSQMTDDELDQAIMQKANAQVQEMDYSNLSDDDLDNLIIEKSLNQQEPLDTSGEAFVNSFGNAASFGYLPQLQAAAEPVIQGIGDFFRGDDTDQKLKEQGFTVLNAPEESYVQRRDKYIGEAQQLTQDNPMASMAGGASGAIVSGIATGGGLNSLLGSAGKAANAGKALTVGQRFKQAAGAGGVIGALRNPGDTEGEVNPLQLQDRAENLVKDAVTGAAVQGGLEVAKAAGAAIKNAGNNVKTWSQMKALKGSGAMLKDFRKAVGNKKAKELGQSVIDNKIMSVGDDVADIAKNSEVALKKSGSKIGQIYDKADSITSLNASDIRQLNDDFINEAATRLKGTIDGDEVAAKLGKVMDIVNENPNPTFGQLRKLRASIDDQINYSKATQDLPKYQEELLNLRNKINDLVKDKIGKVNPGLKKELIKENRNFSNISEIAKMSKDKMAREEANAAFGLRERISGGAGAAIGAMVGGGLPGAIVGGALGSLTTKAARQWGTPYVAITANKVARALENNKEAIGKFSQPLIDAAAKPEKFVATVNALMKDPEFKKKVNEINQLEIYRGPAKGR